MRARGLIQRSGIEAVIEREADALPHPHCPNRLA